ncbi:hypothetical protein [Salmonirosea aquatica]|uniref:Type II toxin-antitoxin system Phd/YefM family antitoxin n=1 Tax=Salmonirosea aquatica TaxID=2654236 RepID=A0A7C9BEL0_9BACT|nr:hypothetical protein [Cytophagaceae bacterium SJW1-29]
MVQVHPQFITDTVGKKLVVLPLDEFNAMIEELEDLEDVRLYDEAKREDDGSRISLDDYLSQRKARKNG